MKILGQQVYRFEGVELDPSQGCLRRNGDELPLRQKSLRALLYLLEQRHRLVTKDELIERVWEGIAVSDDALVQLIKEIRQSLGDDPRRPRFIKTVPKAGYRFIAPVEDLYLNLPGSVEIERHSSVEIEYEEKIVGAGEMGRQGDRETGNLVEIRNPISSPPRPFSLSPRLLIMAAIAGLLLAGGLTTYLAIGSHRRSTQLADVTLPPLPGRKPLAVMYFENQSASSDLDWLREGLADMLITNLSRSKRLNVLSRQQLYTLFERSGHRQTDTIRLDDALEIARKTRAEVIVLGSYVRLGEKIRIEVQLYNSQNGQPLASESIVADKPEAILTQMDLVALKLERYLVAAPESPDPGAARVGLMTTNLEAYRNYSLAIEKAQALRNAEAIALLERAVALDPQFAMAYARIGYAYTVTWYYPEKAKPYLEKAFQLADRLNEKDRLYINAWYAIANRDYPSAIGVFQQIVSTYPMETEAYDRLSRLLNGEDRPAEALEVALRGLAIDAGSRDLLNQTCGVYSRLGRHDEATATCERFLALAPNEPNAHDSLGSTYEWAGRYPEAIAAYQRALALNPGFEVAVIHLANTYFQQGRYDEALEQYQRYIKIAPSDGERARGFGCISYLYWKRGDLEQSETAAKKALLYDKQLPLSYIVVSLDRGNVALAEDLVKRYCAEVSYPSRGTRNTPRYFSYLRGYLNLRSGRTDEAVAEFKEALRHGPPIWSIDAYEDCLANAYLELGRLDEAIAEYQRILLLNPRYPLAHYHLAVAYERKGRKDEAHAAYQRFMEVWNHADKDLPEMTKARKALS